MTRRPGLESDARSAGRNATKDSPNKAAMIVACTMKRSLKSADAYGSAVATMAAGNNVK